MKDSGYLPEDPMRCAPTEDRGEYIDRGYVHDEVAHKFNGVCGHAGLFSTVKDRVFLQLELNALKKSLTLLKFCDVSLKKSLMFF